VALAYAYLGRRERTVAEVAARLERAGISEPDARAAIEELQELGAIDDRRFTRLFVADKRELEQWGNDRIARGLVARGIDRELIAEALQDQEVAAGSELERAVEVLERRFPQTPLDRATRERALGVLLRKGYEVEVALDALARHR
jgi:regulatory protein